MLGLEGVEELLGQIPRTVVAQDGLHRLISVYAAAREDQRVPGARRGRCDAVRLRDDVRGDPFAGVDAQAPRACPGVLRDPRLRVAPVPELLPSGFLHEAEDVLLEAQRERVCAFAPGFASRLT